MVPFDRMMVVFYRLSIVTTLCYLYNHSAAICHRTYPTLKSTGVGAKSERDMGLSYVILCLLSTMHERDRQRDHRTVTSIAISEFVCQRCRLAIYKALNTLLASLTFQHTGVHTITKASHVIQNVRHLKFVKFKMADKRHRNRFGHNSASSSSSYVR